MNKQFPTETDIPAKFIPAVIVGTVGINRDGMTQVLTGYSTRTRPAIVITLYP